MAIDGDLESAVIEVWHAIYKIMEVDPGGHALRTKQAANFPSRHAKEENFLSRNMDACA